MQVHPALEHAYLGEISGLLPPLVPFLHVLHEQPSPPAHLLQKYLHRLLQSALSLVLKHNSERNQLLGPDPPAKGSRLAHRGHFLPQR